MRANFLKMIKSYATCIRHMRVHLVTRSVRLIPGSLGLTPGVLGMVAQTNYGAENKDFLRWSGFT